MDLDYQLTINDTGPAIVSFNCTDSLANNLLLSLIVKKGSFFLDPEFGSRLHEISTTSENDLQLSIKYAEEATVWLVRTKKVNLIKVSAERGLNWIELKLSVEKNSGDLSTYIYFHRIV